MGCFCIKNIYFMLRLLFAIRMVHQVVTWKTKQNLKVTDPKCHMELTNSYVPSFSKEHLGPLQKFPWPILWILCEFFFSLEVKASFSEVCHKFQHTSSVVWATLTTMQDREKLHSGPFHGGGPRPNRRGPLPHHLLSGPTLMASTAAHGHPASRLVCKNVRA